uniref:Uncharacterized protein n=1 Tax=Chenopodium quinoa TaxID=63459 RepID=A0A803MYT0_CHEQI
MRTLVIGEDGCVPTPLDDPDHQSQDSRLFESLVREVSRSDPAIMRSVSRIIDEHLHSDQFDVNEPPRNTTTRGRPQSNSTRRNRSAWEYTSSTRGRRGRNGGRGDGGRSGGRGGQDNWIQARYLIVNEVKANRLEYIHLYHRGLDQAIDRITWNGGHCGVNHYMDQPDDLYPIEIFWNCAVMVYGVGPQRELYPCMTVLPLRALSTDDRPRIEMPLHTLVAIMFDMIYRQTIQYLLLLIHGLCIEIKV